MTSNERKILKYQWGANGRAHVKAISQNTGFTADYTWLLCRSLARAGYLKFSGRSECYLLKKGRSRFENAFLEEVSEGPVTHTANVTLLTDIEEDTPKPASKEGGAPQPVNASALEKALADINLSSKSTEEENQNEAPSRINGDTDAAAIDAAPAVTTSSFNELPDASEKDKEKLVQAGYKSAEDLAQAPVATLIQGLGVSLRRAASWINQARRQTGVINEEGRKNKE